MHGFGTHQGAGMMSARLEASRDLQSANEERNEDADEGHRRG